MAELTDFVRVYGVRVADLLPGDRLISNDLVGPPIAFHGGSVPTFGGGRRVRTVNGGERRFDSDWEQVDVVRPVDSGQSYAWAFVFENVYPYPFEAMAATLPNGEAASHRFDV